jgi:histidyl-tRNA synthetase
VWRNEKPGPGRFRQFTQFDADTVGTDNVAADAEICMLAADTLEALGVQRGDYVIKVSNRKVLDGLRHVLVRALDNPISDARWLTVMRALDKYDRLGDEGVRALLGRGRKDESGDFTAGADLDDNTIALIMTLFEGSDSGSGGRKFVTSTPIGKEGSDELETIRKLISAAGYDDGRIVLDPSVVRGGDYGARARR